MIALQHYCELPDRMFEETTPFPSPRPRMIELNGALLDELGMDPDWFCSEQGLQVLSGNEAVDDVPTLAMAYAGHQFGQWVPLLGDGRAHMLGQIVGSAGTVDVQLKGSGRTRFSRRGDGRATLSSVLREYVVSEAMAALSIPTTRALAVIETGEPVLRDRALPGAILARTAQSHIRVGSFEFARSQGEQTVRALADFVIDKHFSGLGTGPDAYLALLEHAAKRQARLIAHWMLVGFIHGVMNTDNMSVVGETIDYGPCAFMDEFDPRKVFSSIDRFGRYAWNQQPSVGYWNLTRLAASLLPLIDESPGKADELATASIDVFAPAFEHEFEDGMRRKLGLADTPDGSDWVHGTLSVLAEHAIDFTRFFDLLTGHAAGGPADPFISLFRSGADGTRWLEQWHRIRRQVGVLEPAQMRRANPAVIARNHRVEQALDAAVHNQDFSAFRRLCRVLRSPYDVAHEDREMQAPPAPEERVTETFCGT